MGLVLGMMGKEAMKVGIHSRQGLKMVAVMVMVVVVAVMVMVVVMVVLVVVMVAAAVMVVMVVVMVVVVEKVQDLKPQQGCCDRM
jgi:hypothetical protein